jgi:hypothetical protein
MGIDAQMLIITDPKTDEEILKLSYEMCWAFGVDHFFIDKEKTKWSKPHHAISRCKIHRQDGPSIKPPKGKEFLKVNIMESYYGKGYERGNFPFLYTLAKYLEKKTGGEILYGGDSSGILAEPFGEAERAVLMEHFVEVGHAPYQAARKQEVEKICEFCQQPMIQYDYGQRGLYIALRCPGCGEVKMEERLILINSSSQNINN